MTGAAEEGYVFRHRYPEREAIYRSFAESSAETRAACASRAFQAGRSVRGAVMRKA